MIRSVKLPFVFDVASLSSDLNNIGPEEWISHFNKHYHDGGWTGLALRSPRGSISNLVVPVNTQAAFVDTELLNRCPAANGVLSVFQSPIGSVRFLKLAPGAKIREHRDYELTPESKQARIHVPIVTNPEVEFFLDADRVEMQPGECWYLNLSLPHWIHNNGKTDRIHLVLNCEINGWLRSFFPKDQVDEVEASGSPSCPAELERFRKHVLNDLALQQRLRQTNDRQSFARLVVREARSRGFNFSLEDAVAALTSAHRSWHDRWIN